jgi:hypothetical protein
VVSGSLPSPTITSSNDVCFPLTCSTLTCHTTVSGALIQFYRNGVAFGSPQSGSTLQVCPSQSTSYSCSVSKAGCSSPISASVTVAVTDVSGTCNAGNSPPHKFSLCHFPGVRGNDKPICVAIEGFLNGHCPHHPTDYLTSASTCTAGGTSSPQCTCAAIQAAFSAGNRRP